MEELPGEVKVKYVPGESQSKIGGDLNIIHDDNRDKLTIEFCSLCGELYTETVTSDNHFCDHFEDDYICRKCGRDFNDVSHLEKHECVITVTDFPNSANLNEKKLYENKRDNCSKPTDKKSNCITCKKCSKAFASQESFENHACNLRFQSKNRKQEQMAEHSSDSYENCSFSCEVCGKAFSSDKAAKNHRCCRGNLLTRNHKSSTCKFCGLVFHNKCHLKKHFLSYNENPYQCHVCKMEFTLKQSLQVHMARHTRKFKYYCDYCKEGFASSSRLKYHIRTHTGEKPHACDTCGRTFSRSSHLKSHMLTHTGSRPFSCIGCDKSFIHENDLKVHMRVHTGEKPFRCKVCGKRFHFSGSLARHLDTHNPLRKFRCEICIRSFSTSYALKLHLYAHSGLKPFPCDICDSRFVTRWALRAHQKNHNKPPPSENKIRKFRPKPEVTYFQEDSYACGVCNVTFTGPSELRDHVEIHKGQHEFMCNECGKYYALKKSLTKHLITHSADADSILQCKYCGKKLASKSNLNRHVMSHTGEKPFSCNMCDMAFAKSYTLKEHLNTHLKERKFSCHICDMQFTRLYNVKRHMRKHLSDVSLTN